MRSAKAVLSAVMIICSYAAESAPSIPETKDRIPPEEMARLVESPIAIVRKGDFAGGQAAFERLVAAEQNGVANKTKIADLIQAFGVQLYIEGMDGKTELQNASLPYLNRAIGAYGAAFGPESPEVAVALNSYADALIELAPDGPPTKAIESLERAYQIRVAALGKDNRETVATEMSLAALKAKVAPMPVDAAQFQLMLAEMSVNLAKAIASHDPQILRPAVLDMTDLAVHYLRNDRQSEAMRIMNVVRQELKPLLASDPDACHIAMLSGLAWSSALHDHGVVKEAQDADPLPTVVGCSFG